MSVFERIDGVQRLVHFLPVIGVLAIITSTWLAFTFAVSVNEVLFHRKDVPYFIFQVVVFHVLLGLTVMSYIAVVAHRPLAPDLSLAPPDARPLPGYEEWDESAPPENTLLEGVPPPASLAPLARPAPIPERDDDDIPLRLLRNSPQQAMPAIEEEDETDALLDGVYDGPIAIMAKSNTGGPRWCRKCDAWKPDRCHHCRSCRQCVLKMDHHCPWVANCIGYHNYKYFILFVTYAALLSLFGCSQASLEAYRFFQDPSRYDGGAYPENDMEALQLTFTPVLFLLLAIIGGCMSLTLGGLAAYHWYLMMNNRTTLEDIDRSPATALLDADARATLEALGPRGSRQRLPGAWRPDHILTRPERTRLRREAREINVYDLGWPRNVRQVMVGDASSPAATWGDWARDAARAAWPLSRPKAHKYGRGHVFAHDGDALRELKALTREVRLGLGDGGDGESEATVSTDSDRVPPYRRYE